ncbi:cellulase family glycosylhydrolase [Flavobacterium selenitireducens]|uniref:cellulase family glycosylhydrolase n=1 Tax=Flavobacterium selenitireducens TaxID=2722704 RepID=UPI00168B0A34|nr:cellulase family glycosylhydrolase [Flavobacterium selenitireducens]MBD3583656.1 cellulase family glycosylhydrolase [Flavobacterium selenitireducens]
MKRILTMMLLALSVAGHSQYMRRDGQQILDHNGQPIILRGLGLGGWMVQEGYMLQTDAFAGPQHKIREKITQLIGTANTETFYQAYRDNGITKRDIDSLKAWGFNSVRLPMHYNLYTLPIEQESGGGNTWLDEGFERTDQLLEWCEQNQMYLILDMHATPGGQGKDANISDYDATKPSLWESEANRTKLIALWRKLADRYKDRQWIGGYDLINEPNWSFTQGGNINGCTENANTPLRDLYIQLTNAIREVDTNHMIIIEGNCWGNNYNGILSATNQPWDNNMALSFHKYWNANTQGAIQGMLNLRTTYNLPIWLGETGENSNVWFKDAISLCESNNIGWAWWPMKKIDNISGPASVTKTAEYQTLLNYWQNGGNAPSQTFAFNALMQIAENYKMENVTLRPDVIDAMFRQVQTTETKKYKDHPIPGKVFATEFDMGHNGVAYFDKVVANYRTDTGTFEAWNNGWSMRNDGVDIQPSTDAVNNGFQIGWTEDNEWLTYSLTAPSLTAYDIDIRYSGSGKIHFEDTDGNISESIILPNSGGFTTFQTITVTDILLQAGLNKVKLYIETGGFNLNWFELKNPHASSAAMFKVIDASTSALGNKVNVVFNKQIQTGINFSQSAFTLKVNGTAVPATVAYSTEDNRTLVFTPSTPINPGNSVTLSYAGGNLLASDATAHAAFTDKPVTNRVGSILGISGTVQAENFYSNNGLQLENSNDIGGGQNIAYTDAGDSLQYLVNVQTTGNYKIEWRTSGESQVGSAQIQMIGETTQDIQTVNFPATGGWQTWQTVESFGTLTAGRYIMKVNILSPGFNLNWIRFSYQVPDDDGDGVGNASDNCPNTPSGDVVDFSGCTMFTLPTNNFSVSTSSETCRSSNNGAISISAVANHNYVATLTGNGVNLSMAFNSAASFPNLNAGVYQLCIAIPSSPSFQQCYNVVVTEPEDLGVFSRVDERAFRLELDLEGSETYRIELNGIQYMTDQHSIVLDLEAGRNELLVKTDRECQGVHRQTIVMNDIMSVYPNPARQELVNVLLPSAKAGNVTLEVYSMIGKKVASYQLPAQERTVSFDASAFASGTYLLKVVSPTGTYNTKFVKL